MLAGLQNLTIGHNMLVHLRKDNNDPAFSDKDSKTTYSRLFSDALSAAAFLAAHGIKPGSRVMTILPNSVEFVKIFAGIMCAQASMVPLNPALTETEITYIIEDCRPACAVAHQSCLEKTSAAAASLGIPVFSSQLLLEHQADNFRLFTESAPEQEAIIYYTSGTTGKPKGVVLTHKNLVSNTISTIETANFFKDDIIFNPLPFFHSFSTTVGILCPLFIGGSSYICADLNPANMAQALIESKSTVFIGVPPLFSLMLKLPSGTRFPNLRLAISGGAALPPPLTTAFHGNFGIHLHEGYGLTEASPVCSVNDVSRPPKPGTIGIPLKGVRMKVVAAQTMMELPDGSEGELAVFGDNVMAGYLNNPEETAKVLKNGWLLTGDIAKKNPDGTFSIMGRKKELIIVSGENVYPREIEETLNTHPAVAASAVLGVPDQLREEVPAAFVQLKAQVSEKELLSFCKKHLAPYKTPRSIKILERLPINATGKIDKPALKAMLNNNNPR